MKILFCCIVPKSELYIGLAREYQKRGHSVTFLSPSKEMKTHWGKVNDFKALYFECGPVLSSNIIKKGIANLRFPMYALEAVKININPIDYDLILMSTPPLGYYKTIKYLKKANKDLKFYLILRDIHPEGAKFIRLHYIYPLYRYFQLQAISLYRSADVIGCMSPHSVNLIQNRYLKKEKDKIQLLPNWGDNTDYSDPDTSILEKYDLQGKFILIYGGHMGILQNLQIFVKLANEKKNLKDVVFLFIGYGPEKIKLTRMANEYGLNNVRIMDYMPYEDYQAILKTAKVGIISLHPRSYFANIPSKTISYFQNKIPILASIDELGDYKSYVIDQSQAGLWSLADDFSTLSSNFDKLYNDEERRRQMGENGYNYFKKIKFKMNVIFFTLSPSGLYKSLIEQFIEKNHNIIVVTPDYSISESYFQVVNDNYSILHFKALRLANVGMIRKGIADFLFPYHCKLAIKRFLRGYSPDLILSSTPPLGFLTGIQYFKRKNYHCKFYLILRDIWPEAFKLFSFDKKFPLIYKYYRRQEKSLYKIADIIGCMSPGNIDFVLSSNPEVPRSKTRLLPNWGNIEKKNVSNVENIRQKYNLGNKVVFIYGGNMGVPQGLDNIVLLASRMKSYSNAIFLLIGKGQEKQKIQNEIMKNNLNNIIMFDYLPKDDYDELLNASDVGIISLNSKLKTPSIPSKTISYWNLKKPIFAIIDSVTDYGYSIIDPSNSGLWALANDTARIDENFIRLSQDRELRLRLGLNGFNYFISNCTVSHTYNFIMEQLYG